MSNGCKTGEKFSQPKSKSTHLEILRIFPSIQNERPTWKILVRWKKHSPGMLAIKIPATGVTVFEGRIVQAEENLWGSEISPNDNVLADPTKPTKLDLEWEWRDEISVREKEYIQVEISPENKISLQKYFNNS